MIRLARWKVVLCILAVVFGLVFTAPNLLPADALASLPNWVPHQRLNLGLDLQGGSYLLYEVDTKALKAERLTTLVEDARTALQTKQIQFSALAQAGGMVDVRITDPTQLETAFQELSKLGQALPNGGGKDVSTATAPDQHIHLVVSDQAMAKESVDAVQQSIEIIRKRIDSLGTREPAIQRQGTTRIVVEAPGESDPERLKAVIGQTAKLSFQMVDDSVSPEDAAAGHLPPGSVLLPSDDNYDKNGVVVKRRVLVSGDMLVSAAPSFDQNGRPDISFRFNAQGGRRFGDVTAQNIGKRFAIVVDNRVISAPVIQGAIPPGSTGEITGSFTVELANNLAIMLKSGALPAKLDVIQQKTVGAELGADAIRNGQISLAIGAAAIFVFIIFAYGLFGVFAAIALVINGLMLIAAMSVTQATLTLPGIAGLVLTLAVAVDANVLIYERMRDEARSGRSVIASLDHGYSLAWPSIADANLTSLISAAIMFWLGSGPVKGFAWTLSIGVMTSVFTAMLVTQVLIGWWFRVVRPKTLPI